MSAIGSANLEVIARRWPRLFKLLQPCSAVTLEPRGNTFVTSGLQLSTAYDRVAEAHMQAAWLQGDEDKVVCFGIGLGDLPRLMLERPRLKALGVLAMNLEVTKAVLEEVDLTDWLEDRRVHLDYAGHYDKISAPFVCCPADVRLSDAAAYQIRDVVYQHLNFPFNLFRFNARKDDDLERVKLNQEFIDEDREVSVCHGVTPGMPAVVVAGGPTTEQAYEWLRTKKPDGPLIVCSTALLPLQRARISPDVVCIIDTAPQMINHFQGMYTNWLSDATLVYETVVSTDVIALWPGRRLVNKTLWAAGTVAHAAVDMAVKMGCSPVYLIGFDFCYPGGKSHMEGAAEPYATGGDWRHWAINGHGQKVKTDNALCQYYRELEGYIQAHSDVKFIKLGKDGVPLKGAEWMQ